jgi:hypothetical protein
MSTPEKPPVNRDSDKFMLRLPDGMRDMIAEVAKENNRSMNAEIVARLSRTFDETAVEAYARYKEQLQSLPIDMILDMMLSRLKERDAVPEDPALPPAAKPGRSTTRKRGAIKKP